MVTRASCKLEQRPGLRACRSWWAPRWRRGARARAAAQHDLDNTAGKTPAIWFVCHCCATHARVTQPPPICPRCDPGLYHRQARRSFGHDSVQRRRFAARLLAAWMSVSGCFRSKACDRSHRACRPRQYRGYALKIPEAGRRMEARSFGTTRRPPVEAGWVGSG